VLLNTNKNGVTLRLRLAPKSSKDALVKFEADTDGVNTDGTGTDGTGTDGTGTGRANTGGKERLKATVTAVPEKGKANTALIKLLAKKLGLPKTRISLIAGDQSRYKTVHFEGPPEDLIKELKAKFRALGLMD